MLAPRSAAAEIRARLPTNTAAAHAGFGTFERRFELEHTFAGSSAHARPCRERRGPWPPPSIAGCALTELDENTARGLRVQECDRVSVRAAARLLVDQPDARGREPGELGADVGDPIRCMVQLGRRVAAELRDRRVLAERSEQFDDGIART